MILIAYLVFGLFLLARIDYRNRGNLVFIGVVIAAGLFLAWLGFVSAPPLVIGFNSSPLVYFFPNPPQQWYFERPLIVTVTGLIASIFFAIRLRRVNSIPLFMLAVYLCFLSFFLFSSIAFFKPRHLLTTQIWYPVLIAFGLFILWTALQTLLPSERKMRLLLAFVLAFAFGKLAFNEQQVLFPITSNNPEMPITRDYVDDLSAVHAFMLEHVEKEDVLISTVYPLYVTWKGDPIFQALYRITISTPEEEVETIIERNPTGWLVIDQARLEDSVTRFEALAEKDHLEYMGLFNNQYVWYWKHNLP
jgi:hypothetical protein